ncbi:hypothetical protein GQ53DRAFT_844370 [Thozetella sp. PMI_491]|nr:hypothetical protein GQ53DRAFT_844370 [Thozetella sp. PMI_491]
MATATQQPAMAPVPYPGAPLAGVNNVIPVEKKREGNPLRFRWAQLALRGLSSLYDLALIIAFAWLIGRYPNTGERAGLGFSAAIIGFVTDGYEIFRLIGVGYKKHRVCAINPCAAFLDAVVAGLAMPGWIAMVWNVNEGSGYPDQPRKEYLDPLGTIALLLIGLSTLHLLLSILSCIGGCVVKCAPKRREEVVVVYVPMAAADLEQMASKHEVGRL